MKKVHIDSDHIAEFNPLASDTIWIIDAGVTMSSSTDFAFRSVYENTHVVVKGKIDHSSSTGSALALYDEGGGVKVAASGKILSDTTAVYFEAEDLDMVNNGLIKGNNGIVLGDDACSITNNSDIIGTGLDGIKLLGSGSKLLNAEGALVKGPIGIEIVGNMGETSRIENHGTIRGDNWAIDAGAGDDHIINRGKIVGSVLLGDGQNIFDTRGGTIEGDVAGGLGEDTYIIDSADVGFFEVAEGGYDTIRTSVSYALDANTVIEGLTAIGGKDVKLTGNNINNRLNGNGGDNVLKGKEGADWLDGGKGDDVMTGGQGADDIIFEKGGNRDIVTDFTSGEDKLRVEDFNFDNGYDDLMMHLDVHKGDIIIKVGQDRIILDGITAIVEADVVFSDG